MKIANALFLLSVSFLLLTCEDFFQSTIDVEIPIHESKLSYAGFGYNLNDTLRISQVFGHSRQTLSETQTNIQNRQLKLKHSEEVLIEENIVGHENEYSATTMTIPQPLLPNKQYDLEVSADGWESIYASQTMPSPVEIEYIEYEANAGFNEFGGIGDAFTITFSDNGDEENYYLVSGKVKIQNAFFNGQDTIRERALGFSSSNPTVATIWSFEGVVFNDAIFNGKTYQLKLNADPAESCGGSWDKASIKLFSLTKEAYNYILSFHIYYEARDNPFSEPVVVFENIENGYGIFALANATEKIVEF